MERLLRELLYKLMEDNGVERSPECKNLRKKYWAAYCQLKEKLSAENQAGLEELSEMKSCFMDLEKEASSVAAFRLGALLMIEIHSGRDAFLCDD